MKPYKRKSLILAAAVFVSAVLLSLLLVSVNHLINQRSVLQRVAALASERSGGRVSLDRLTLTLLPGPGIRIHNARFDSDAVDALTILNLSIYPRVLPLFIGKLRVKRVSIENPVISLALSAPSPSGGAAAAPVSVQGIQGKMASAVHIMASDALNMAVDCKNGTVSATGPNGQALRLYDIDGHFDNSGLGGKIRFQCRSNLAGQISIDGHMETAKGEYLLTAAFLDLDPGMLIDYLPNGARFTANTSQMDVEINMAVDRTCSIRGGMVCSYDSVDMQFGKENLVVRGGRLEGVYTLDNKRVTASLMELKSEYPQLSVSGDFLLDFASGGYTGQPGQAPQKISLEINGSDIHIPSVREVLEKVAGKNPIVADVLNRITDGEVSAACFQSQGKSFANIWAPENFIITGDVQNARLYTPEVELTVDAVQGKITIADGIIEGEDLAGRVGNTTGRNGRLTFDPAGANMPFTLDIALDADLAELPALLGPVFREPDSHRKFGGKFGGELGRIKKLSGQALGRLVLGDSIKSLQASVEVKDISLSLDHGRIPYPVTITKGQGFYRDGEILIENLTGKIGNSSFQDQMVVYNRIKNGSFEYRSGRFILDSAEWFQWLSSKELFPWLASNEVFQESINHIQALSGMIEFTSMKANGPISEPRNWHVDLSGRMDKVSIQSDWAPGILAIEEATFKITPEQLRFDTLDVDVMDASLKGSASVVGYMEGVEHVKARVQGSAGEISLGWTFDALGLTQLTQLTQLTKAPLAISSLKGDLTWTRSGTTRISGDLSVREGPEISVEVIAGPDEFQIKNLHVRDNVSNAVAKCLLTDRVLDVSFSGIIKRSSLKLLAVEAYLPPQIEGDFAAHIVRSDSGQSIVTGHLEGEEIVVPLLPDTALIIDRFHIEGAGDRLLIRELSLLQGDARLHAEGDIRLSPDTINLRINAAADTIDLEKIEAIFKKMEKKMAKKMAKEMPNEMRQSEEDKPPGALTGSSKMTAPDMEGSISLAVNEITYGEYRASQVKSEITLRGSETTVHVSEADICGIHVTATLDKTVEGLGLVFQPVLKNEELNPVLLCLANKRVEMDGRFDVEGLFAAQGAGDELINSLTGSAVFEARTGRIYTMNPLTKVIEHLNTTNTLGERLQDPRQAGFNYNTFILKTSLAGKKATIRELVLDGTAIQLVGMGDIDFGKDEIDMTVLVVPLKTVNRAVQKVPVVGYILDGAITTFPIHITGRLSNPDVSFRPISKVGSDLVGIAKRTLMLPAKVTEPVFRGR